MDTTKIKINFKTGEFEVEGTEEFVQSQVENLESIIEFMSLLSCNEPSDLNEDDEPEDIDDENKKLKKTTQKNLEIPKTFGEWLHKFNEDISDLDKSLITAYYVQKGNSEDDFKTSEVNKSLKDHGIKLSNPSDSLKKITSKKYLFQTRKVGKLKYMRVSSDGVKHMNTLLDNS